MSNQEPKKDKKEKKEKKNTAAPADNSVPAVYTVYFSKDQSANPDLTRLLDVYANGALPKVRYMHHLELKKSFPTLVPVDTTVAFTGISGDASIARYLAATTPALSSLVGTDAWSTAQVNQWLEIFNFALTSSTYASTLLEALETFLLTKTFLAGYTLSLADLAIYVVLKKQKLTVTGVNTARWVKLVASYLAEPEAVPASIPISFIPTKSNPKTSGDKKKEDADEGGACPPLVDAEEGKVVTRFPPEPSGYMHIGHTKAVLLNQYYAERYKGKLIIRFDDTNPSKEKDEYEENILQDLKTLSVPTDFVTHSSDYFKVCEDYARTMISEGKAYMDDTPQDQMQAERMEKKESKNRNNSVEVNLAHFEALLRGDEAAQKYCLRAKIDMSSVNGTMRDPVLYRFNDTPHHRTGTQFKAYPTYDFACPIIDSIEGVTHALRTTEYNDRDEQYHWIQNALGLRYVHIQTYGKLNFIHTVLSKRKLNWFVENKIVEGWFDPRFPTIQGCVRRGVNVQALKNFIVSQGASRRVITMEWDKFWSENKKVLEETAPRYMGVDKEGAVVLNLTNISDEITNHSVQIHPQKPELGERIMRRTNKVYLDQIDAATYTEGEDVTLLRWGNVKINKIHKDADGKVTSIDGTFDHEATNFSKTKKATWLAITPEVVEATFVEYDHLISKAKLEEDENFQDFINHDSKRERQGIVDPCLRNAPEGQVIQLERKGFFRVDQAFSATKPLILIAIPDGKVKK